MYTNVLQYLNGSFEKYFKRGFSLKLPRLKSGFLYIFWPLSKSKQTVDFLLRAISPWDSDLGPTVLPSNCCLWMSRDFTLLFGLLGFCLLKKKKKYVKATVNASFLECVKPTLVVGLRPVSCSEKIWFHFFSKDFIFNCQLWQLLILTEQCQYLINKDLF